MYTWGDSDGISSVSGRYLDGQNLDSVIPRRSLDRHNLDSQNGVRVRVRVRVSVRVKVRISYDCPDYDCPDFDCPYFDIPMPAAFFRHGVGQAMRNVCHCDTSFLVRY